MPKLPRSLELPAMPSPTFSSILNRRLGEVGAELAYACETLAKERESLLHEEIQNLQSQVAELRKTTGEAIQLTSRSSDNTPLKPLKISSTACKPAQSPASSPDCVEIPDLTPTVHHPVLHASATMLNGVHHFSLLPELQSADLDAGLGDDELEKADSGYNHRQEKQEFVIADACVVDPASTVRLFWDLLGIPILSWDLITIPLQVFDGLKKIQLLFDVADWVTLIYWSLDIPFTFFTGYYDRDAKVILNLGPIARNYFRGPFLLDICIILSDWTSQMMDLIADDSPSFLANVALLRVLRISRFARLVRLRKLKRKLQTIEDTVNNEWYLILFTLIVKVFSILVVNHYICCGWYWLGNTDWVSNSRYRWLTVYPYPAYDHNGKKMADADFGFVYLTSLHWAIAQFTPGPQNIQAQNKWERLYTVFVLLFGMVVFSSFIAAVTQARMQMTKMMSKFERDFWLLRKFCRQHGISQNLQQRMKRYIDFVVVPAQAKLAESDCLLIQKLSPDLREQLKTEIASRSLGVHPLFRHLQQANKSVMHEICTHAVESTPLARGDVAFVGGQAARFMSIVVEGYLEYLPLARGQKEVEAKKGTWIAEATFWTHWIHQGQLQASIESSVMVVDAKKFREALLRNQLVMGIVRQYGTIFVTKLNDECRRLGMTPSDLDHSFIQNFVITKRLVSLPSTCAEKIERELSGGLVEARNMLGLGSKSESD